MVALLNPEPESLARSFLKAPDAAAPHKFTEADLLAFARDLIASRKLRRAALRMLNQEAAK